MPSPIESLRSQINTAIRNQIEVFFKQEFDAFKVQTSNQQSGIDRLLSAFFEEQLDAYRNQLPNQPNGVGGTIGSQTIDERERGATDFVDFVLGARRPEGAHIRKGKRRRR
jgi:hypothetical protein